MNKKSIVKISDIELEDVSGGVNEITNRLLLKGLTIGAVATVVAGVALEHFFGETFGNITQNSDNFALQGGFSSLDLFMMNQ